MKKVIKGKLYDTQTALPVGRWTNGKNPSDYNYYYEELYLKKTGEYFYFTNSSVSYLFSFWCDETEREKITPITNEQAKEWAERRLSGEEYISLFGPVEE